MKSTSAPTMLILSAARIGCYGLIGMAGLHGRGLIKDRRSGAGVHLVDRC